MDQEKEDQLKKVALLFDYERAKNWEAHGKRSENEILFFYKYGFYLPKWMVPVYLIMSSLQGYLFILIVIWILLYGINKIYEHRCEHISKKSYLHFKEISKAKTDIITVRYAKVAPSKPKKADDESV